MDLEIIDAERIDQKARGQILAFIDWLSNKYPPPHFSRVEFSLMSSVGWLETGEHGAGLFYVSTDEAGEQQHVIRIPARYPDEIMVTFAHEWYHGLQRALQQSCYRMKNIDEQIEAEQWANIVVADYRSTE